MGARAGVVAGAGAKAGADNSLVVQLGINSYTCI